jgi:hypothetical protein
MMTTPYRTPDVLDGKPVDPNHEAMNAVRHAKRLYQALDENEPMDAGLAWGEIIDLVAAVAAKQVESETHAYKVLQIASKAIRHIDRLRCENFDDIDDPEGSEGADAT